MGLFLVDDNCRRWRGWLGATNTIPMLQSTGSFDMQRYSCATFDRFINYYCCCFCYSHLFFFFFCYWRQSNVCTLVETGKWEWESESERDGVYLFSFLLHECKKWVTGCFCDVDGNDGDGNDGGHVFYSFQNGMKISDMSAQDLLTISSHSQLAWHFHIWSKKKTHR